MLSFDIAINQVVLVFCFKFKTKQATAPDP